MHVTGTVLCDSGSTSCRGWCCCCCHRAVLVLYDMMDECAQQKSRAWRQAHQLRQAAQTCCLLWGLQASPATCLFTFTQALAHLNLHAVLARTQYLPGFNEAQTPVFSEVMVHGSLHCAGTQEGAGMEPQSLRLERSISRAQKIQLDSLQRQLQVCLTQHCFANPSNDTQACVHWFSRWTSSDVMLCTSNVAGGQCLTITGDQHTCASCWFPLFAGSGPGLEGAG